jgi:myo-inositol 2-dehydrogenase/D-chiro-inositol 1-dehydrogenase
MTVNVGVIGAGMIGQAHIRRLAERVSGARVAAVADVDAERAKQAAQPVAARALASGEDVIADPEVDAVVVTSWGPAHAQHVLAAIAAGKPVFCEKPLATTEEDCRQIVAAEVAAGRRLVQVGFMRRYDPGYRQMKAILDSGGLGAPLLMHCVHRNPAAAESYHSEMATRDTAVHELDVVRWLLADEIVSAQVVTGRSTTHRFPHLIDPQFMLFETASGVRVDLEVFVNCQYGYDIQCELVAELGTIRLPDPAAATVRHRARIATEVPQGWPERFAAAFDAEFAEWVADLTAGRLTGPSAWDGYAVAVASDATVRALHSGRIEPVNLTARPAFYAQ